MSNWLTIFAYNTESSENLDQGLETVIMISQLSMPFAHEKIHVM